MVNEHYAYHSNGTTNTNTHLHSVSLGNGHSGTEATLVQIDAEPVASKPVVAAMGQPVDNQRSLLSFRKFPIRSILKNSKVHNSSSESLLGAQPKSGILKKPIASNGIVAEAPKAKGSAPPVVDKPSSANQVSAKGAASTVQFRIENASSTAASNEQSSDTSAMSSTVALTSAGARPSLVAANLQPLSASHLQVPSQSHSAMRSSVSSSSHHVALPSPSPYSRPQSSGHYNPQPAYYTATTSQRMSDLRKILNPEVEQEDSFKKFTETIENCFECNLNNAAKLITVLVLLATLVLVIRALKGDRLGPQTCAPMLDSGKLEND